MSLHPVLEYERFWACETTHFDALGAPRVDQTYTCPVLSIHTFTQSSDRVAFINAAARFPNKNRGDPKLGDLISSEQERLFSNETVVMVPIENVANVYYTVGVMKSVKTSKFSQARVGCCGRFFRKAAKPSDQAETLEEKNAEWIITMHLQYFEYSNLDIVYYARDLPELSRAQFYNAHFQPIKTLKLHLVWATEYAPTNFDQKKTQTENLCRLIMQLKGMSRSAGGVDSRLSATENMALSATAIAYASPSELLQMLNQPYFDVVGDFNREDLHSTHA